MTEKASTAISVIMPVYNVENFLQPAIDSVFSQSIQDWELILVDDGSTDFSGRICDEAARASSKVKAIHKCNGGLSSARNAGLEAASGDYIFFLDSDDLLPSSALETLRGAMLTTGAEIACGDMVRFHSQASGAGPVHDLASITKKNPGIKVFSPADAVKEILYQRSIDNSAPAKLYSSRLWRNMRFREGIGYEDLDLFYKVFLKADKVATVTTGIYLYRQHPSSYLHKFSLRRADVLRVTENIVGFMSLSHPSLLPAAKSRQLSANLNILGLISSHRHELGDDTALQQEADRIAGECWQKIKELRGVNLRNPNVRIKNKLAIMASYIGGRRLLESLSKIVY